MASFSSEDKAPAELRPGLCVRHGLNPAHPGKLYAESNKLNRHSALYLSLYLFPEREGAFGESVHVGRIRHFIMKQTAPKVTRSRSITAIVGLYDVVKQFRVGVCAAHAKEPTT